MSDDTTATSGKGPLSWTVDDDTVRLKGSFTEQSDFAGLLRMLGAAAALDLTGVDHINSTGVRAWMQFVSRVQEEGKRLELRGCSVMFMSQLLMIANFTAGFWVKSFLVRFACEDCDRWEDVLLPAEPSALEALEETRTCTCGGEVSLDDLIDPYREFLGGK